MNRRERRRQAKEARKPEALHLLGILALQEGRGNEAIRYLKRSLELNPSNAECLNNLGQTFESLGRLEDAIAVYRKAISLIPDFADAQTNLGNVLTEKGELAEAIKCHRRALENNPGDPEILCNLGGTLLLQGKTKEAITSIRHAQDVAPEHPAVLFNLGNAFRDGGKLEEAVACYQRALENNPGDPEILCNLGGTLLLQGKTKEAITSIRHAQDVAPEHPAVLFNLGNAFRDGGKLEEAIVYYNRALENNPDELVVLCNLGYALHANGSPDEAITTLERVLEIDPDFVDAHYNLYIVFQDQGRVEEAFKAARHTLRLSPENPQYWNNWAACISQMDGISLDDRLFQELETYLDFETAKIGKTPSVIQELVLRDARLEELKLLADADDIPALAENLANGNGLRALSTPLLLRFIPRSRVISIKLETFLTTVRQAFLHLAHERRLERTVTTHDGLNFLTALAQNCFLNEYVYLETVEDTRQVDALVLTVTETLKKGGTVKEALLALIACYRILGSLDNAQSLLERENFSQGSPLAKILGQQIREPQEERKIRSRIPRLTTIDDEVSHMVRKHYEENPYPRWLDLGTIKPERLHSILTHQFPHLKERAINWPTAPQILVAGCGSGYQPIHTACHFKDASVLAIDLSLTSLAYAERKRRELEVGNLELMQADIIELTGLGRRFDIIICSGVLHHMNNPEAGWRVLADLLKPGGFMDVGLYSDLARGPVTAARSLITEKGYRPTPGDIRQCRYDITKLADDHPAKDLWTWSDFFTTSTCRDLIFHTQEHRFTISRIASALNELALEFIGFTGFSAYRVLSRYRERFPQDEHMTNLNLWDEFERDNPDTFRSMYQFFAYKSGGKE